MMWTTIPASDSRPELPQTYKSTALAAAVARRERASDAAVAASASGGLPGRSCRRGRSLLIHTSAACAALCGPATGEEAALVATSTSAEGN
ncbi:hypothetical protein HPB52_007170 [Rhipicephalus sanguineus]|uniref:Uncharacterized protein n=1 Tax=Rhipicephalus sanguineus TaxID=34632 RepID=A0A9D4Q5B6_RHISA|nr:hypothetical protein HPB52_007170 [Rhipicephalus sanguineus]